MRKKEAEYLINIDSVREEKQIGGDRSAFLNMLYLKTVDLERDLRETRNDLRKTQWQLLMCKTSMGERDKYNTEKKGKTMITTITAKYKSAKDTIIVAGVAGLIMSLFIAFVTEYIEESKSRRKRE